MIGFSLPKHPQLLLFFVLTLHKADCWCNNSITARPLRFEMLRMNEQGEYKYLWFLPEGYLLELSCCVVSTSPSVSWRFNGRPINEFKDMFVFSENEQYLSGASETIINNTVLGGVYNCTAVEGNETVSAEYSVTTLPTGEDICTHGKTTDVKINRLLSSLYGVASSSSLTLECKVLLTCHPWRSTEDIYWEKYYMKDATNEAKPKDPLRDPNRVRVYRMFPTNPYDKKTGNYVNVTISKIGQDFWIVTTVLHITNITDNDLHDAYDPDGYASLSCENSDLACRTNRTRNYYKCGYLGSATVNPLQNALATSRVVRLFSGAPPTLLPQITIQSGNDRWEQDGVLIGSTIGAAFILVSVLALLFVAYEWHLKLYVRRVFLQLRKNHGAKTAIHKYNCYVTCCMKDDQFVYEVLRRQMEEQYGYRLCLPERDFSIGTAIPDEIERCIQNSEYFMAIISPGFWETAWCKLSVDLALRTNAKVVAVIAKELSKDQRDQGDRLMTALKTPGCTIIESRLLSRESSWEKLVLRLRYVMPNLESI